MDCYYGCENSDFNSPEVDWSEWGINAPEGLNSPQECYFFMDTNKTEVEFNSIYESFKNEIEFDPSRHEQDQSSSSSVCGGSPELQLFQQTPLSSYHLQPDYQLQDDLSNSKHMDDIFLDSVLEDFTCVESLHKSLFYPENQNQCSNSTVGVQKDIVASEFVPWNSGTNDCLDKQMVKVLDLFQQSNGDDETMQEHFSVEEFTLLSFQMIIAQFTEKTRIGFRDALYHLARNTKQHVVKDLDKDLNLMHQAMAGEVYNNTMSLH